MTKGSDIGLIGLAVMGKNLVLNMRDHGFSVSVYNRSQEKTREFLEDPEVLGSSIQGFYSLQEFVSSLERPRKILLMIKSGDPVDHTINALLPFLEEGDIIIDGGNSYFLDSERRFKELKSKQIFLLEQVFPEVKKGLVTVLQLCLGEISGLGNLSNLYFFLLLLNRKMGSRVVLG